jgi:hypothetical protein
MGCALYIYCYGPNLIPAKALPFMFFGLVFPLLMFVKGESYCGYGGESDDLGTYISCA